MDSHRIVIKRHAVSSWALKVVMAITGILWAAFLAVHLFGNLKVFFGPEAFNVYAAWLRQAFYPFFPHQAVLWLMRIILTAALAAHVAAAATLWSRGRANRKYRRKYRTPMAWAAASMPLTGILILVFIGFHLLDLTVGYGGVASSSFQQPNVETGQVFAYQNLIMSFQRPAPAIFYIVIMVLLGLHLAKGAWNIAADLGAMGKRLTATIVIAGGIFGCAVFFGNALIPFLVLVGSLQ